MLDTVGCVCVDNVGRTAASSSSGGIILKQPGRVGQVWNILIFIYNWYYVKNYEIIFISGHSRSLINIFSSMLFKTWCKKTLL